jgi:hypothetical protein
LSGKGYWLLVIDESDLVNQLFDAKCTKTTEIVEKNAVA